MSGHAPGGRLRNWWAGWLAALRISRREARRAKGRSALVVALIGLPVCGLAFAAVGYDSFRLTPVQKLERELGTADASLRWEWDGPIAQMADGRGWMSLQDTDEDRTMESVTEADLLATLPAGSRATPRAETWLNLRTATGVGELAAEFADLTDPIHQGRLELRDGRAPAGPDEVAVTRWAANRLGVGIGDTVTRADDSASWRVVGVVEFAEWFREALVVHPDAAADLEVTPHEWLVDTPEPVTWERVQALNQHGIVVRSRAVVLDPPPPEQIHETWRGWEESPNDDTLALGVVVAGLAMLEVVLLAGPAFAVGARRRQRDLAVIGANGGTPAQLRRIVLADGVVLGLVGAVVGIVLGVAGASAGLPLLEEYVFQRRAGGWRLWPSVLAGIAGLALLTGVLAALIPATTAARQHLVTALAGRRGITRAKRRWLLLGIVVTAIGAAIAAAGAWRVDATVVLAGLVATQLGLALCTPALVGLVARAGRFLPLAPRIALRDTARNRAAAAPAIAAVMAAVAGSLALGIYLVSEENQHSALYVPVLPPGFAAVHYDSLKWAPEAEELDPAERAELAPRAHPRVVAALREHLPVEEMAEVWRPACPATAGADAGCHVDVPVPEPRYCPWLDVQQREHRSLTKAEQREARADERCATISFGQIYTASPLGAVIDDGTALPVLTGATGDDLAAAVAMLRDGGVVVTDPWLVLDGQATVEVTIYTPEDEEPERTQLTLPAHALDLDHPMPTIVLSPAAAQRAGLGEELGGVVVATAAEPPVAAQDATNAALTAISEQLWLSVERGWPRKDAAEAVVLAAAAGLIALGAAAIATGLAAADRRPDLATLAAVGASPRVRRSLSLSQSGVIAGLGGLLGATAGVGAAFAVLTALNQRHADEWPAPPVYPLSVPWPALALVLLVVPGVAMLGAGLLTRSRLPVERRRA